MPERTPNGSDPPPPALPAPADVGYEGRNQRIPIPSLPRQTLFTLFYEIGFYIGFPLKIKVLLSKIFLKTNNLVQTFHFLDKEKVQTSYLLDKEIKVQER